MTGKTLFSLEVGLKPFQLALGAGLPEKLNSQLLLSVIRAEKQRKGQEGCDAEDHEAQAACGQP